VHCGTYGTRGLLRFPLRYRHRPYHVFSQSQPTSFTPQLINPAPRPTVIAALLHPHDVVHAHTQLSKAYGATADQAVNVEANGATSHRDEDLIREPAMWELPDTTILFRRFVEAGRMVNVYDWFESFKVVLEDQRRQLQRRSRQHQVVGESPNSPTKAIGMVNAAAVDADQEEQMEDADEDQELDEEEEERWRVEVQARFMRALHELDFTGFIKHTGRKADHVIRTIYDVPD